jgi:hypothetical protein
MTALGDGTTPKGGWFAGAVTSAGSGSVSLDVLWTGPHDTQLNGTSVAVGITPSTNIVYGKGQSSIAAGDLIRVRATGVGSATLTAKRIHVNCNCHFAAGTLDAISSSELRVSVDKTGPYDGVLKGQEVTFQAGSTSVGSLKVGDRVRVTFAATGFFKDPSFDWQTATFTAKRLHIAKG